MGYKILGYMVWQGGKWYAARWASRNTRALTIAGAGAGVLLLATAGAVVALKQRGGGED